MAGMFAPLNVHRPRLFMAVRIVTAAVLTFVVAHVLGLSQSYWAVLTAVIVMQASVGGSIKAVIDRLVGSLGGALWGVAVCLTLPGRDVSSLALALVIAVAPLALATAFNPAWRIAPVTAIILLLTPTGQSIGPLAAAASRMLEVAVGSLIAVAVVVTLGRSGAAKSLTAAVAETLTAMAGLAELILAGGPPESATQPLHARIRLGIGKAETAAAEIARERSITPLAGLVDAAPMCRTLRRLHHDLIMIGRADVRSSPAPVARLVSPACHALAHSLGEHLSRSAEALRGETPPPSNTAVRRDLGLALQAVAGLRTLGMTRSLPDDAVAQLFGLAFALEQLGANLDDLARRVGESL